MDIERVSRILAKEFCIQGMLFMSPETIKGLMKASSYKLQSIVDPTIVQTAHPDRMYPMLDDITEKELREFAAFDNGEIPVHSTPVASSDNK
jgi:hypothetical protein